MDAQSGSRKWRDAVRGGTLLWWCWGILCFLGVLRRGSGPVNFWVTASAWMVWLPVFWWLFYGWSRMLPDGRNWHNRFGVNMGLLLCPGINLVWAPVLLSSLMYRSGRFGRGRTAAAAVGLTVLIVMSVGAWIAPVAIPYLEWWWAAAFVAVGVLAVIPLSRWARTRYCLPMRRRRFWRQLGLAAALCGFLPWSAAGLWWCYRQWRMENGNDVSTQTNEVKYE